MSLGNKIFKCKQGKEVGTSYVTYGTFGKEDYGVGELKLGTRLVG